MMRFDLTDDETFALLNLLTETIETDRYPAVASHPDLTGHPREIRADRARTATAGLTRPHRRSATLAGARGGVHGGVR